MNSCVKCQLRKKRAYMQGWEGQLRQCVGFVGLIAWLLYGLVPSDDKTLQKVPANGKLHKAASADQHYVGELQQGQQQQLVVVEEGDVNNNLH